MFSSVLTCANRDSTRDFITLGVLRRGFFYMPPVSENGSRIRANIFSKTPEVLFLMPKLPFMKWYPSEWWNDTRSLSIEAKGCYIEILNLMWNAPKRGVWEGTYQEFARVTGAPWENAPALITELEKVVTVTRRDNLVTLKNRRMVNQEIGYKNHANRQKRYRDRLMSDASVTGKTLDVRRQTLEVRQHLTSTSMAQAPKKITSSRFQKPTPEEVALYAKSISFDLNGQSFCDFYESKGWRIGSSPMKDWQAAVRTWKRKHQEEKPYAPHGSKSIHLQVAERQAERKSEGLRKASGAREIFTGIRNLPDVSIET